MSSITSIASASAIAATCATKNAASAKVSLPLSPIQGSNGTTTLDLIEKKIHQKNINEYHDDFRGLIFESESKLENSNIPEILQPEILEKRFNVVKTIYELAKTIGYSYSTFALAVHMIDTYTSLYKIDVNKYHMIGRCCLWSASKYHENKQHRELKKLTTPEQKREFLDLELSILKALKWDLSIPTCDSFVDLFNNTNSQDLKIGSLFLCELALFNKEICFNYSSSAIAAAAITLSSMASGCPLDDTEIDELEALLLQSVIKLGTIFFFKGKYGKALSLSDSILSKLISFAFDHKQKQEIEQQQQQLKQQQKPISEYQQCSKDQKQSMEPLAPSSSYDSQISLTSLEQVPQLYHSPSSETNSNRSYPSPVSSSDFTFPLSPATTSTSPNYRSHHRHNSSISALRSLHIDTSKGMGIPTPVLTPGITPIFSKASPAQSQFMNLNLNSPYLTVTPTSAMTNNGQAKGAPNGGSGSSFFNYGYTPLQFQQGLQFYPSGYATSSSYQTNLGNDSLDTDRSAKRRRFN